MDLPVNPFKRKLRHHDFQVGLFVGIGSPYATEIVATAGFDWLLIDAEHSPNTPATALPQLQAAAPYPVALALRPVDHDPALIKQYLDIGVQTLLAPLVDDAAQAVALVRAMRYPPRGIRGVGASLARAARWNAVPGYLAQAEEELCLIVQIETRAGLENLDAILAVDGVDAAFIGPADLAASLGHLGEARHPEVVAAIEGALRRIAASGKGAGVFVTDPQAASRYRECGASFVAVGGDTTLLRTAAAKLCGAFRGGGSA